MYEKIYANNLHLHLIKYNTTIKTYANGDRDIKHHSYSNIKGLEKSRKKGTISDEEKDRLRYYNLLSTKSNIIDLIYHNGLIKPWEYFITLTFDDTKVNGYDYNECRKALMKWLDNQKHQNPNLEYVIVPEYHKSKRFHFHGVVRNCEKWRLSPAFNSKGRAIYKNGARIYNLDNYKYGYTTISKIKNAEAVSVYTSKYITKEFINIENAKKYWASKSLSRPTIEYAQLTEDGLKFYIDKSKVVSEKIINKEFSSTYYVKQRTSYNIYYVNFHIFKIIISNS